MARAHADANEIHSDPGFDGSGVRIPERRTMPENAGERMHQAHASAHPVLRALSRVAYSAIASWPPAAKAFLMIVGGVLRNTGSFPLKRNIVNSLMSHAWPPLDFKPHSVSVSSGHALCIVPHVGEFDFRALFQRTLDYEPELFEVLGKRISRYDAIVEIGANVGIYSQFFAKCRRDESVPVFCFEPSREALRRLSGNVRGIPNLHALPAAVSDTAGLVLFHEPEGHLTNGSLLRSFADIFSSNVTSSIVPAVDGSAIEKLVGPYQSVLLKIDVEGHEPKLLKALSRLIAEKRPDIVLEVLDLFESELNALQLEQDYDLWLVTSSGLLRQDRLKANPTYRDYLLTWKQ